MNIPRLILTVAIVLPLQIVSAFGATPSVTDGCSVSPSMYRYLAPNTVKQVQNALAHFSLYGNRIDGIAGPDTRRGIAAYCLQRGLTVDASVGSRQALIHTLIRDAAIDRIYHDWRRIIVSPSFTTWIAAQNDPAKIRTEIDSGTSSQVIVIIDRYLTHRPAQPAPVASKAPPKPPKANSGVVKSQAKSPETKSQRQGAPIDNRTISYQLNAKDLKTFAVRRDALEKLSSIKGGSFQSKATFIAGVKGLLEGSPVASTMLALTKKYAEKQMLVTLGKQGLQRLKAARVPESVLGQLGELENPGYTSRGEALKAIRALLSGTSDTNAAGNGAKPLPDDAKWAPLIASQLDERVAYRLTSGGWNEIERAAGAVPGYVPSMLKNIRGVDYPLRMLFVAAAQENIDAALNNDSRKIREQITSEKLTRLDDAFFAGLEKNGIPAALCSALASPRYELKNKTFSSTETLNSAVAQSIKTEGERFKNYEERLADHARKRHVFDRQKSVSWTPAAGPQFLTEGSKDVVYGFYPYWLAGETQQVYFSGLGRIGYYGVGFDDRGMIQPTGWTVRNSGAFAQARRYRTRLDLVVTKRDWLNWKTQTQEKRKAAFSALAANIATLLNVKSDDLLSKMADYSRLGIRESVLGDGVTLFFENYPTGREYTDELLRFIKILGDKLAPDQNLNLMLPRQALGEGAFAYTTLANWVKKYDSSGKRMLFLVLLKEPDIKGEEELRRSIEEHVPGAARRDLLRMTLPVVVPDKKNDIHDEVVYASDNFGGIGFWPLPAGNIGKFIATAVKNEFYPSAGDWEGALCRFVGLNRWLFRLAFYFFLIVSLSTLGIYLLSCRSRAVVRRHFVPILAGTAVPTVFLGMSLLGCDPILATISKGNIPLFLVLIAIIIYAIWDYGQRRKKIP